MQKIITEVADRLSLPFRSVDATVKLLDEGSTIPFISRYRKEVTGSLNEVDVRNIESTLKSVRELFQRRDFVIKAITDAGAMTPQLNDKLQSACSITDIEDIYAPFKPKKHTRGSMARERGLEPLAKIIMSSRLPDCLSQAAKFVGNKGINSVDDALSGACDIIAEWAADNGRLRNIARNEYRRHAVLKCSPVKDKVSELISSPYAQYADFAQPVRNIPSHRYLAMHRAEREGLIKVKYEVISPRKSLEDTMVSVFMPPFSTGQCAMLIAEAVADASKRLIRPSVENEISSALKDDADRVAIDIFAGNLRQLLLASPLKNCRVLAIDPGFRTGCKVVALDEHGNFLADSVIYPTVPNNDFEGAKKIVAEFLSRFNLDAVALGNGTASRETENFLKRCNLIDPKYIFVISEDGASVYSASEIAREEFPHKDVTVRGAVSIGRRLIDPLAELVKIDPKSIGVGQYQHDVDQSKLKSSLDFTVMSCVNSVGVDLNTASECLLRYISGIGPNLAKNIVAYRKANGPFKSREQLYDVARLGAKAFEQCAGFLRITDGSDPLDNTGIHPESYSVVKKMAESVGAEVADLPANSDLLKRIDVDKLAADGVGGLETMTDIIDELLKPGRDPRSRNDEIFTPAIDSFDQIFIGMKLPGVIDNITAFGAFVNLGIHENGLLHISKISNRRVNSVADVLHLGQLVEVTVVDLDRERHRISLSMI